MIVNPYEPPKETSQTNLDSNRTQSPRFVSAPDSVFTVVTAGIVGGVVFYAFMTLAPYAAIPFSVLLTFLMVIGADWFIQKRRPAVGSAAMGMLLASPIALALAFGLGNLAYGMGAKWEIAGGVLMALGCFSFFAMLSVGAWMAICRTRQREPATSDGKTSHR